MLSLGLGELPDHEVLRLARSTGRVIITLDEDFTKPYGPTGQPLQGIIYLDLPNGRRHVRSVNQVLGTFFRTRASEIDLERALVTVTVQESA